MSRLKAYKGYEAEVEFDADARVISGRVLHIRDGIYFEGESVDEVETAFKESVDDYLAWCAERGEEPDKPYSGKVLVRMEPSLHRAVAIQADREGSSVNAFIVKALERATKAPRGVERSRAPTVDRPAAAKGT